MRRAHSARQASLTVLAHYAALANSDAAALRRRCEVARERVPEWSGTTGFVESPARSYAFGETPLPSTPWVLIAVDGSQIFPSRHKPYLYGYARAQCQAIAYNAQDERQQAFVRDLSAPMRAKERVFTEEELVEPSTGELQAQRVALERSLLELEALAEACTQAREHGLQPLALADGMLIPFGLLGARLNEGYAPALERLLAALQEMRKSQAWVCGYVDRPNSQALVQTIMLSDLDPDAPDFARQLTQRLSAMRGVLDRHLLERLLPPKHHTAPFVPAWRINALLEQRGVAVHAFYANFGAPEIAGAPKTVIARLEVPAWCADVPLLQTLCAVVDRQVQFANGYPLLLATAHEAVAVTRALERTVDQALHAQLAASGIVPEMPSFKEQLKEQLKEAEFEA